ncbi:MAG: LacI family transcriptional regulator [Lachnospiraceae bacterium]|nr:LacI family transcriptional regulator [Lachnospiraceae bacterium]
MATINDIAAKLGVSKSTVSKGLNNATDISEEMRKKILETAVELGYSNKRLNNREKKLCIIIENMDYNTPNQFGHDIIQGFKQMAEPDGWTVDIIPIDKDFQRNIPYGVFMIQNGYLGAFVLGFSLIDPWMPEFKSSKIPAVLYDNYISSNPHIASVGCDCQEGFDQIVKHLLDLGHKKIGLISGPLESYILKARYNAYINALSKYNLEINDNYIGLGYYVNDSTKEHVKRMYDIGITAIICSHDVRAISAITECNDKGLRIPEDLSIVGFDDLPMTAYTDPPLTTVRQDRTALGKAGYYAMSCLQNDLPIGSIMLRAPLIVRGSTGPARRTD